jgi:hypothetical protein
MTALTLVYVINQCLRKYWEDDRDVTIYFYEIFFAFGIKFPPTDSLRIGTTRKMS